MFIFRLNLWCFPLWLQAGAATPPPIPCPRRLGGVERLPWMGAVTASRTGGGGGCRSTGTKSTAPQNTRTEFQPWGSKERFPSARCQVRVDLLALPTKKKSRYTHQSPTTNQKLPTQVPITEQFKPPSPPFPSAPYSPNNAILHLPRAPDPSYITPSYITQGPTLPTHCSYPTVSTS